MRHLRELIVLIRGGGEVGSGIAHRLHRSHFRVCITELAEPQAVSRGTSFSEAIFDGTKTIEGVTAELANPSSMEKIYWVWRHGNIPIIVDPEASVRAKILPDVLVNAMMLKRETGTQISDAPLVIGIGTGFFAGKNAHMVIESSNSNDIGRVLLSGEGEPDTGEPTEIGGLTRERVIWAEDSGVFTTSKLIGDAVVQGELIGQVGDYPVTAPMSGILRGLLRTGIKVLPNTKLIEIDPVNDPSICLNIRARIRSISGGVLEGIMIAFNAPPQA
jgi:xanthine dehydrogenase accessory factor